ncbi:formyltransferase family protein [Streptomyces sioyaensis]|uniref:formyltransferase family protein n=1 Tax=Streptomyces sioyaensis TaxID=67364 RepID=UPI0037B28D81
MSGGTRARFRCWLVGEGALPVACGEELLARGHRITGFAGADGPARQWAAEHGIPCADRVRDLRGARPDHLLSIVNPAILDAAELRTPREMAINFHSSPLPRYAGVHQTAWAVLNGEQHYGVTWHVMAEGVDSGDILVQEHFPLEDDETTLSLGIKAYDHGLTSFTELLDGLERGRLRPRAQDLGERTYFSRRDRMPGAGLIGPAHRAEEVERWCRAASVGDLDNVFGSPKLLVGDEAVVVHEVSLRPASPAPPGTRVPGPPQVAVLATPGADLVLHRLRRLDGTELSGARWAEATGLAVGDRLALPDDALRRRAQQLDSEYGIRERYWTGALTDVNPPPAALPGLTPASGQATTAQHVHRIRVPAHRGVDTASARWDLLADLAAAWLSYAAGFGAPRQTVWWSAPALRDQVGDLTSLFATAVPVTPQVPDTPAPGADHARQALATALQTAEKKGTFPHDLPLRRPRLGLGSPGAGLAFALETDGPVRLRPTPWATVCLDRSGPWLNLVGADADTCFALASVLLPALSTAA